jgi:DNA-binding protein YbaB
MESGDNEMLQDLVMTAVNEAVRVGRANLEREMANISGGIRLPGMF